MGAGRAKLSAILLMAAMWSSTAITIHCSNAWKAKRKDFPAAYKNVSLEKRKNSKEHTQLAEPEIAEATKKDCYTSTVRA